MKAARAPRADKTKKLLVVKDGEIEDSSIERLPDHLRSGDLLVVNDAATLPASLPARDARNNRVELRLTKQLDERVWQAAVFGAGDWRTPTEDRPPPPRFAQGEEILIARTSGPESEAKINCQEGCLISNSIFQAKRCGGVCISTASPCNIRTSRTNLNSGPCRTVTAAAPGRSRCPARDMRSVGDSC